MISRTDLATHIADLVGGDLLDVTDPGSGWPALGTLAVDDAELPVSLFVGVIGLSHRGRDDVERRFQNPGQNRPITPPPGRHPLLLGLIEEDPQLEVPRPLLVQADPHRRVDRLTRFSVFVGVAALCEAWAKGWSEEISTSREVIRCLVPPLLPVGVSAARDDVDPATEVMQAVISGSGLMESDIDPAPAAERARRAGSSLVRDARFRRCVASAYSGQCAMCGIDANLIQAAHIYPAAAPGSQDEPWNGLALCPNHHAAFDQHLLAVHPETKQVIYGPDLKDNAAGSPAMATFVDATYDHLAEPDDPSASPRSEMFFRRYQHFRGNYDWLHVDIMFE